MSFRLNQVILNTALLLMLSINSFAQQNDLNLWYDEPSGKVWEKPMPIDNGRLATMGYGNPGLETVQLNEATLWSGGKLSEVKSKSNLGGNCRLRVPNNIKLQGGVLKTAKGANPNFFYQNEQTAKPIISAKAQLKSTDEKPTLLYDLAA